MHLIQVPAASVDRIWPVAKPHIAKACELSRGMQTPETAYDQIKNHNRQLWIIVSGETPPVTIAAGMTSLQTYPTGKKVLQIEALGGANLREWFDLKSVFEKWAKDEGCSGVIAWARKGWAKHLPDYTITRYVMYKEIS